MPARCVYGLQRSVWRWRKRSQGRVAPVAASSSARAADSTAQRVP